MNQETNVNTKGFASVHEGFYLGQQQELKKENNLLLLFICLSGGNDMVLFSAYFAGKQNSFTQS
jgi:hypothetical protein